MAGGGEIAAVFKSLAEDAAKAGEDIGKSISKFVLKTADTEDENVARVLDADAKSAEAFSKLKPNTGNLSSLEGSASGDAARGANLLGDDPPATGGVRGAPAGGGTGGASGGTAGSADPRANWPDPKSKYPKDYVPSTDPPPTVAGPHESPENWVNGVNKMTEPGRDNNCSECSRAVDSTWHGNPKSPAAMSDPYSGGEPPARMEDWAGQPMTPSSMGDVHAKLQTLGPGSSAIVGADWKAGGGHWFNAVNDGGAVKAVDGQSGIVEGWPPTQGGLGFDESQMSYSDAVFFGPDGKVANP